MSPSGHTKACHWQPHRMPHQLHPPGRITHVYVVCAVFIVEQLTDACIQKGRPSRGVLNYKLLYAVTKVVYVKILYSEYVCIYHTHGINTDQERSKAWLSRRLSHSQLTLHDAGPRTRRSSMRRSFRRTSSRFRGEGGGDPPEKPWLHPGASSGHPSSICVCGGAARSRRSFGGGHCRRPLVSFAAVDPRAGVNLDLDLGLGVGLSIGVGLSLGLYRRGLVRGVFALAVRRGARAVTDTVQEGAFFPFRALACVCMARTV